MSHCLCRSLAVAVAALPLVAAAPNVDGGRREYMISCAPCHRLEGKGEVEIDRVLGVVEDQDVLW